MKCLPSIIFVSILTMTSACSEKNNCESLPTAKIWVKTSEGVVLHGCGSGSIENAWLENTNPYPVRIRQVWQAGGETTISISLLKQGTKLNLSSLRHQHGFYIYTIDGIMVGWLSGDCPE